MKMRHRYLLAVIFFNLIIALALTAQPTQANLPEQTVPTAKPSKTKSASGGNQTTPVFTSTSEPIFAPTSIPTDSSGITFTLTLSPTMGTATLTPALGIPTTNSVLSTSALTPSLEIIEKNTESASSPTPTPTALPATVTPINLASNQYIYYGFLIILSMLIIVTVISRRRKTTGGNPPQS